MESANRRNFIKKASLVTAAVGLGGTLLGKTVVPQSAAKSDGNTVTCNVCAADCVIIDCSSLCRGCFSDAVFGHAHKLSFGSGYRCKAHCCQYVISGEAIGSARSCGSPNPYGLDFYTNYNKHMSISQYGYIGIGTDTPTTALDVNGDVTTVDLTISGYLASIGTEACITYQWNLGTAGSGNGLLIEPGSFYFEHLINGSPTGEPKLLISECGRVGIGTINPCSTLCVCGDVSARSFAATCNACCGSALYGNAVGPAGNGVFGVSHCSRGIGVAGNNLDGGTGVRGLAGACGGIGVQAVSCAAATIPLVAQGFSSQTAPLQQWKKGCTVESVVNNCGWLGLGRPCAPTTLAVCGSLSAHVATPGGSYTMSKTDFAVLANGDVTLPSASTAKGMIVFIKNIKTSSITVSALGSDKIEGKATKTLSKEYDSLTLISNGGSPGIWYILSSAT